MTLEYSEPCHIQNSDIFRNRDISRALSRNILVYLERCVTLSYWEPCHIQNPDIFRNRDISRALSRNILVYSERCVTLAYWEPCHIQNFAVFRILAYLESFLFRYIHEYSSIFTNDSYNNINFLFFTLILHFSTKFKNTYVFDHNDVNFNALLSFQCSTECL